MIPQEVNSTVKELARTVLVIMVEESLENVLRTLLCNGQNHIWGDVYSVVEQVLVDLFRKEIIEETWDTHMVRYLDSYAAE